MKNLKKNNKINNKRVENEAGVYLLATAGSMKSHETGILKFN